ncbi:unnamed protein product [Heterotrigona itama]|uniref:Uncharacterized protein n=1 Tax=Heterotrigona itama TaxID=395501 RepID=A0A6V7H3D3_9HYME|nr:unnamed protein product [Heterotrigona itama]
MDIEISDLSDNPINGSRRNRSRILSTSSEDFGNASNEKQIIDHLLINNHHREEMAIENQIPSKKGSHFLHSYKGLARETRQRCKEC